MEDETVPDAPGHDGANVPEEAKEIPKTNEAADMSKRKAEQTNHGSAKTAKKTADGSAQETTEGYKAPTKATAESNEEGTKQGCP